MISLDIGVMATMAGGSEHLLLFTRSYCERMAKIALNKSIKAELDIYNVGGLTMEADYQSRKGLLASPYWFCFPLGVAANQNVTSYSPKNLMHYVDQLPRDSMFMAFGFNEKAILAAVQATFLEVV